MCFGLDGVRGSETRLSRPRASLMNASTPFFGLSVAMPERQGPMSLGVRWNQELPTANLYTGSVAFERGLVVACQADG